MNMPVLTDSDQTLDYERAKGLLMNEHKVRAAASVGGTSGRRPRKHVRHGRAAFNGVVTLNASEFARFEECMTGPAEPTEAAQRGAALLRKLFE